MKEKKKGGKCEKYQLGLLRYEKIMCMICRKFIKSFAIYKERVVRYINILVKDKLVAIDQNKLVFRCCKYSPYAL